MGNHQRAKYKHRHCTPAQQEALARARRVRLEGRVEDEDKENRNVSKPCETPRPRIRPALSVDRVNTTLLGSSSNAASSQASSLNLKKLDEENAHLRRHLDSYKVRHHNERRKLARAQHTVSELREKVKETVKASKRLVRTAEGEQDAARRREQRVREDAEAALAWCLSEIARVRGELSASRKQVRLLKKLCARYSQAAKNPRKPRVQPVTFRLKHKGVYTLTARMLARQLVRAGCAQDKVGLVLQTVSRALGTPISERMSAHTVRRAVLEAGIASDVQIGRSILRGKAFTGSGDATTDRHINYEARHVLVTEPTEDGKALTYKNLLVGVDSTPDHTSERQVHDWIEKFNHIVDTHNHTPSSKTIEDTLNVEMCALKLKGMGGDHAADQIKTSRGVAAWKKKMTYFVLGRDHVHTAGMEAADGTATPQVDLEADGTATSPEVEQLNEEATAAAINAVGLGAWEAMFPEDRVALFAEHLEQATVRLGESVYNALPDDERQPLDRFLRLGCAMHKDLNAVKGGNAAMTAAWAELPDASPPVLLANKDNASTLRDVDPEVLNAMAGGLASSVPEDLTPAELRAFESSTRGGVKLT